MDGCQLKSSSPLPSTPALLTPCVRFVQHQSETTALGFFLLEGLGGRATTEELHLLYEL